MLVSLSKALIALLLFGNTQCIKMRLLLGDGKESSTFAENDQSVQMRSLLGTGKFPVYVKTLEGDTIAVDVPSDAKVADLIAECKLPVGTLLSLAGTPLYHGALLADVGVCAEATLDVQLAPVFVENYQFQISANKATLLAKEEGEAGEICLSQKIQVDEEKHVKLKFPHPTKAIVGVHKMISGMRNESWFVNHKIPIIEMNLNLKTKGGRWRGESKSLFQGGEFTNTSPLGSHNNEAVWEICIELQKTGTASAEVKVEYLEEINVEEGKKSSEDDSSGLVSAEERKVSNEDSVSGMTQRGKSTKSGLPESKATGVKPSCFLLLFSLYVFLCILD